MIVLLAALGILDMVVNEHFKAYVQNVSQKHMKENYVGDKISTSERRILMTTWSDEAWESIDRSSVERGFKKCGLSTNVDGSENPEVYIEKIPDYQIPLDDDEFNEEYTFDDDVEGEMVMGKNMLRMKVAPKKILIAN